MVRPAGETFVCESSAVLVARRNGTPRTRHALEARAEWRHKLGRTGWTATDVVFGASLFAIFMLNMLDITITLIHISAAGWIAEGNPLIRTLALAGGALLPTLFKIIVIVTSMTIMWQLYRRTQLAMATARTRDAHNRARIILRTQVAATAFLFMLYAFVIQNNVVITWLQS